MKKIIYWLRQDLRVSDNPALIKAANSGLVMLIYILDNENADNHAIGEASRWWLYHSLQKLNQTFQGNLNFYRGNAEVIIQDIVKRHDINAVYWNRCYEPWRIKRDARIKDILKSDNIEVESFNGSLLWEPWDIKKDDGTAYRVFTPFYHKACLTTPPPREPIPKPETIEFIVDKLASNLDALELLPNIHWHNKLASHWLTGEYAAQERLYQFLKEGMGNYKQGRNFPSENNVSRLSPYLHFGEISPNQVWYAARTFGDNLNIDHFCSELGWREFSHHLLYQFPDLPHKNLQSKFDKFPWRDDETALKFWQRGQTGYPIVDAGMRELWQTGYMHNRVRMIVASFLVKNLLLDWRHGEKWFWDCLLDADLANNSASWQWVAGCGADAAPYFRIFNPIGQGQKFDADGTYTRRYVPELAKLPNKYLFCPWEAPESVLAYAGIKLGKNYPRPIVDIALSRSKALEAFSNLKL